MLSCLSPKPRQRRSQHQRDREHDTSNQESVDKEKICNLAKKELPRLQICNPGSKNHPGRCKPCRFNQGDAKGCQQEKNCQFCHMYPKICRKSKHQRDIDQRKKQKYQDIQPTLATVAFSHVQKMVQARHNTNQQLDAARESFITLYKTDQELKKQPYPLSDNKIEKDMEKILEEVKK